MHRDNEPATGMDGHVVGGDAGVRRTYASVLVVQAVVLLALWAAERYFAAP